MQHRDLFKIHQQILSTKITGYDPLLYPSKSSRPDTNCQMVFVVRTRREEKLQSEIYRTLIQRPSKYTNFVEFRNYTLVYRRYKGVFFTICCDPSDNEMAMLEAIHLFVECLDDYFVDVCELDLVFGFYKVFALLDEFFLAGELQESSKKVILARMNYLAEVEKKA